MNQAQKAAFQNASGVGAAELTLAIASVMAVMLLLWLVWIALAHFKLWQANRITEFDFAWNIMRAAIIALLLGYIIR